MSQRVWMIATFTFLANKPLILHSFFEVFYSFVCLLGGYDGVRIPQLDHGVKVLWGSKKWWRCSSARNVCLFVFLAHLPQRDLF
jgi:hypothetical protein